MTNQVYRGVKQIFFFISLFICAIPVMVNGQHAAQPRGKNNLAYKWGDIAMNCTADDTEKFKPRPTVTSRYLGLIWTAIFDAWSRYDEKAIPVYLKDVARRPSSERN